MPNQHGTTRGTATSRCMPVTRDTPGLLEALEAIDEEGWDSEPGTALLTFVRTELVRPLT